jgi:hypothetical protein
MLGPGSIRTAACARIVRATLLAFAAMCVFDASALTVVVTAKGNAQLPAAVAASARRIDGNVPSVRKLQLSVGGPTEIDLGEGTWELTTSSEQFWTKPVFVSGPQAVTVQLWPRGSIHGALGSGLPSSGEMLVHYAPSGTAEENAEPTGTTVCPFTAGEWNCFLPAAALDLRFNLTGFATEFRWDVKVLQGLAVDAGRLDFTPGSSVFGKVLLSERADTDVRKAVVSLEPGNVDPRNTTRRYTATPDARGFFQVRGLAPGDYALRAQLKDLVTGTRTIRIIARTNASLKDPLILARPGRVTVKISPPLDLRQKPWQVTLSAHQYGRRVLDVIGTSRASATGNWSHDRLVPGEYNLTIAEEGAGDWYSETLMVGAGDGDRLVDVVLLAEKVTGTIVLGDGPLAAAKVRFGDENGPALVTDHDGRFEGVVPPLKNDEATLLVTSTTPDVQRTLKKKGRRSADGGLDFEIALPATTILGRTVHEDGSPEPSAIVSLRSKDDRVFEQMLSKEDGSFQFAGFDPGTYALQADAYPKVSAVVYVEAGTDDTASTDLVLRAQEQVRGRISMRGAPVAGADVHVMPRDTKALYGPNVTSDASGRFVASLPPGTRMYDIIVVPRGFYVTGARITRDPKLPDLTIEVGQDGGSLTVDAPDDDAMLLLKYAGGEFSLAWLAWVTEGVVSMSEGRQRITIPNLEPALYSVCRRQKCASAYVPPFASASVTVDD